MDPKPPKPSREDFTNHTEFLKAYSKWYKNNDDGFKKAHSEKMSKINKKRKDLMKEKKCTDILRKLKN